MQKTALITGASKRIGKAITQHLASQRWNVAIHCNTSGSEAEELRKELTLQFPFSQFAVFRANLMDEAQVQLLIPAVFRQFGSLDLLVNNASVFEPSGLKETSFELLQQQMTVNFQAPFLLCRDLANICEKSLIINFVDTRITNNRSNFAAYSISKKALWELTKMAALEFAPNIRVNAIAPGVSLPPVNKHEKYLWNLAKDIPMQKPGGLEPILRSLDFILANDHLTGQLIFADGGENLGKN